MKSPRDLGLLDRGRGGGWSLIGLLVATCRCLTMNEEDRFCRLNSFLIIRKGGGEGIDDDDQVDCGFGCG